MAGCADRRGRIRGRVFAWRVNDLGRVAHTHSDPRFALRRSLSGNMGLATLCLRYVARDSRRIHRELRPGAPRRGTTTSGHNSRLKVNSEICLSCEAIERYLGEEEERVHALRGISLDLEPRSIHAVVGPSGCGKSTLLYILGLLDPPDAGRVSIESEPMLHLSDDELAHKRSEFIGFIFQFHFLMEDFTAQENVMIPMRERAAGLLEAVGLGDKLRRPSRHLSGGEQQRVAIARALANDPRVILADEPTGNLDTANSDRAFELLQNIVQQGGNALLLATHNPVIAEACDWIHEMKDGRIIASHPRGTRSSIFQDAFDQQS